MCQWLQIPFLWHSNKSADPRGCDCPGCNCSCYIHSAPFGVLAVLVGLHFHGHVKALLCAVSRVLCQVALPFWDQERSVRCWYWFGPKQTLYIKSIPSSTTMLFRLSQHNYCCLSLRKRRYASFFFFNSHWFSWKYLNSFRYFFYLFPHIFLF